MFAWMYDFGRLDEPPVRSRIAGAAAATAITALLLVCVGLGFPAPSVSPVVQQVVS
jgi:hypothetical protein